ncbi:MAG: hypothetical protein R3C11_11655 [Planctomycetaceae bacterium]
MIGTGPTEGLRTYSSLEGAEKGADPNSPAGAADPTAVPMNALIYQSEWRTDC